MEEQKLHPGLLARLGGALVSLTWWGATWASRQEVGTG